ncbi:MAG: stage II sporulation protein P [Turicibacter sp.]
MKSRSKKKMKKISKIAPYLVATLFVATLVSTQFFSLFYVNQKEAYEKHVNQDVLLSSIFDFSVPSDFISLVSNFQKYFTEIMTNIDLNQLYSFLNDGFAFIQMDRVDHSANAATPDKDYKYNFVSNTSNLDKRPNELTKDPLVYIYNTHTSETYEKDVVNVNLGRKLGVMDVSKMVSNNLDSYGITSLVEMRDVTDLLLTNNWNYYRSYEASRMYLEDTAMEYESLGYFVDVHRDSVGHNKTTTEINGKSYAKILFVVGQDHPGYKQNLQFAKAIDTLLNMNYPGLSKGIMEKGGEYTNGIYNQDFAPTVICLEVGGVDNTQEELANTAAVIAEVLNEYIQSNH